MVGGSTHGWSRSPWEAVTSVSGVEPADAIGQQAGSMSDVGRVKISWTLPAIMRQCHRCRKSEDKLDPASNYAS